jgi:hypothetical protein
MLERVSWRFKGGMEEGERERKAVEPRGQEPFSLLCQSEILALFASLWFHYYN